MASPSHDPAQFWNWFQQNAERLRTRIYGDDSQDRDAAMQELASNCPDLTLELMQIGDRPQLIVSADGNWEKVDLVRTFVDTAPTLDGWDVTAFRPRMDDGISIQIQGESIGPDDIRFRLEPVLDGVRVILLVKGLNKSNEQMRGLGASLLAQHAIGEEDMLTLVDALESRKQPLLAFLTKSRPFDELADAIDQYKAERYPVVGQLKLADEWQAMEGEVNDRPVIMLLNVGLGDYCPHPAYPRRLNIDTFFTQETIDEAMQRTDEIAETLGQGQQTLLALISTCIAEGKRTLTMYTSDEAAAMKRLEQLRQKFAPHEIHCNAEWDTYWTEYEVFRAVE